MSDFSTNGTTLPFNLKKKKLLLNLSGNKVQYSMREQYCLLSTYLGKKNYRLLKLTYCIYSGS